MLLNIFPLLLSYGFGSYFLAPFILRIAVAAVFTSLAINHFKYKKAAAEEIHAKIKWISHESAVWLVGLLLMIEVVMAALIFFGAFTQFVAVLSILGFAKMAFFRRSMPTYAPLSVSSYLLLIIICLTLVLTGAGAFAFDLPL
jgi:uncharacterized membrane protein YphA (DoxX/SURF4 family)